MKRIIITFVSCFVLCSSVWADTSVWKVSDNGKELFLGGTCHVLRRSDFPLPNEFDQAYARSELIVFETDIDKSNSPETQQKMISRMIYRDGTSLKDHLSPSTYDRLNKSCEEAGIPLTSLNNFKPVMVMLTLLIVELKKLGIMEEGVDRRYYQKSRQDNKPTFILETIDEQIDFIASMGEGNEDDFVRHSLDELNRTKEIFEQLIRFWKQGDSEDLDRLFIEPTKRDFPEIYRTVLKARNDIWLPKIEAYLMTKEIEFVLVGFAHLVGEDGIVEQLKRRGYRVEKL